MSVYTHLMTLVLISTLHGRVHAGRIIGGQEAVPHSRPYMALVTRHNASGIIGLCGGFLVNEEFVMTAAHCKAESYTISLGINNVKNKDKGQTRSVAQSFPHSNYIIENGYVKNDIMLLKLNTRAELTENVAIIDLAENGFEPLPQSCSTSGWGQTSVQSGSESDLLMEVNVTLIHTTLHRAKGLYCSNGTTGPNHGDSGGPLVCNGLAYGVVSFGFNKTGNGEPFRCFTKIPKYRDWADQIMGLK